MNSELIAYYVNLLILQYRTKPKAEAHIQALVSALMLYDVAVAVRDGFDIDTAVGPQMDILGKYLGASRIIYGTAFTRAYFGYSEHGTIAPYLFSPFMRHGDIIPDVQYYSGAESGTSLFALTDVEYRLILKLRILRNTQIPSVYNIDILIAQLFGANIIFTDHLNMSIGYIFADSQARIAQIAQSEDLLPRPSGVGISLSYTLNPAHVFAYSSHSYTPDFALPFSRHGDTSYLGGYNHG